MGHLNAWIQILSPPLSALIFPQPVFGEKTRAPLIFSIGQLTCNLCEGHRGDALEDNVLNC